MGRRKESFKFKNSGGIRGKRKINAKSKQTNKQFKRDIFEYGEQHPGDLNMLTEEKFEGNLSERRTVFNSSASNKDNGQTICRIQSPVFEGNKSEEEVESETNPMTLLLQTFNLENPILNSDSNESEDADSEEGSANEQSVDTDDDENASTLSDQGEDAETIEVDQDAENDPIVHFEKDISQSLVKKIEEKSRNMEKQHWPALGQFLHSEFAAEDNGCITKLHYSIDNSNIKEVIRNNMEKCIKLYRNSTENDLTPLQNEILSVILNYKDLLYPHRAINNGEDIRFAYCLHVLNHVIKSRNKIVHHNAKLSKRQSSQDEYRDQGLTRPKVLIVVPFRDSALRIITLLTTLFYEDRANIMNKARFQKEYSGDEICHKNSQKPDDYKALFSGNIDDAFRIGIGITRKSFKIYADFYSSDIIIASPLGLRTIIGAEGEKERDYDFLSSIEVLIFDQMDVFLMQNWEHIIHIMQHLHLQPKESHNCDFFRVRLWTLNGWSKFYRQTIIFSNFLVSPISAIFNKYCHNYAGSVFVKNPIISGSICQVFIQLPQVFHQFDSRSAKDTTDERFQFFISKILQQHKDPTMSQTLIFIPSYFDFVRIRNYFKKEELSGTQICEYTKDGKVAKARDLFYHGHRHFLLYTERFHFFHRYQIKGIRHILFYQLPTYSQHYSEMCNFLHQSMQRNADATHDNTISCTVMYCKYDIQLLEAVVGSERATNMLNSDRKIHLLVSGAS